MPGRSRARPPGQVGDAVGRQAVQVVAQGGPARLGRGVEGVEEHDLADALSRRGQPPGHLEGHDAAPGVAAEEVGAARPHPADRLEVELRHLLDARRGRQVAVDTAGLEAVDGLLGPEPLREVPEDEQVPAGAVHAEERQPRASLADQDEGRPAGLRGRRAGLDGPGARRVEGQAEGLAHPRGQGLERRRREERGERQVHAPRLLDPGEEPHRDERVAAEGEEAVVEAHLLDAEQVAPHRRELRLDLVAGRGPGPLGRRGRRGRQGWVGLVTGGFGRSSAIIAWRSRGETRTCTSRSWASTRRKRSKPSSGVIPCSTQRSSGDGGRGSARWPSTPGSTAFTT